MAPSTAHPYGRSATDVRRRAQRERHLRRQRIASLIVLSLLVITVAVGATWAWRVLQQPPAAEPSAIETSAQPGCPAPDSLPAAPEDVTVQVLNGTNRTGLAGEVTEQLADRGFRTRTAANGDLPKAAALIRAAPEDYLAARSVAAQLPDAQLEESEDADAGVVVLILGEGFSGLAGQDAASAAMAEPVPMPERCG